MGTASGENVIIPRKLEPDLPCDPAVLLLVCIQGGEIRSWSNVWTPVFIAACYHKSQDPETTQAPTDR